MDANFIDGGWTAPSNFQTCHNPSDLDDIIGRCALSGAGEVACAVSAAKAALPGWSSCSPQVRADLLDRVGQRLLERAGELGTLLAREEGKTLIEGIAEATRAGMIFKFQAQEALRIGGDAIASVRAGVDVTVTREAVGVVGLITPWNFPLAIPAWKIAPALAYGNVVVFKPSELTSACATALVRIIDEAGCPPGVINMVLGAGEDVGKAIVVHPEVRAVSFTGSVGTGHRIALDAAGGLKRLQLEMGGKNPMVVMADADLELAVSACLQGTFYSTGQRCTASSRLLVQRSVHDAFVARLSAAMAALKVGHALDPKTQIGPVVSARQLESNLRYVDLAREEGAEVIGGEVLTRPTRGHFQAPALFLGANNAMRVAREEIFGPCAAVIPFDDYEEALELANDTEYGLVAGICTSKLHYARDFRKRARAGMVMVNLPTAGVDYHVPFGGCKGSSHGPREQGRYAAEFYTQVKTVYEFS